MKVILVGNYEPDRQESMQRFAGLLLAQLRGSGVTAELVRPPVCLGRVRPAPGTAGKWLGYVDKYVLEPLRLRWGREVVAPAVVHICDHSNAPYVRWLRGVPVVVTCHDLLAVRSAAGEFPENPTGYFGRRLQMSILEGLRRAPHVACVSEATRADVLRLAGLPPARVTVIPNGLNHPYRPMGTAEASGRVTLALAPGGGVVRPYLLHVGGNQWYKNRAGVLHIYRRLLELMPDAPDLLLAGKALTPAHRAWIVGHGLERRVRVLEAPDNELLRALYSRAALLLFPSLAEGFGWPILEAQACGCPVVTSRDSAMEEVGGEAAHYCNPRHHAETAALVQRLLAAGPRLRTEAEAEGRRRVNVARFTTEAMTRGYLRLYERMLAVAPGTAAGRVG